MPPITSAMNPKIKRTYRVGLRYERAARLALDPANYTIAEIARMMGVAPITVSQWRMDPVYQNKLIEIQSGVIAEDDRLLRENIDLQRDELRGMVPTALLGLRNMLLSKNEGIRLKAIGEILDRDGQLAKVSKTSVVLDKKPSTKETDAIATELATLLHGGSAEVSFTVTAEEANMRQQKLEEVSKTSLEDIDLSGQRPQ